jgi:gentisate 1,2-dioxygenase
MPPPPMYKWNSSAVFSVSTWGSRSIAPPFLFSMSHNPIMSLVCRSKTPYTNGKRGQACGPTLSGY